MWFQIFKERSYIIPRVSHNMGVFVFSILFKVIWLANILLSEILKHKIQYQLFFRFFSFCVSFCSFYVFGSLFEDGSVEVSCSLFILSTSSDHWSLISLSENLIVLSLLLLNPSYLFLSASVFQVVLKIGHPNSCIIHLLFKLVPK